MTPKSKAADARLKREFFVSNTFVFGLDKYNELLKFQGGVCAICGCKPTPGIRLATDHDHYSGLLRGLLDMRCNRGYGLFVDNKVERLLKSAEYLINPPAVKLWGKKFTAPGKLGSKRRAKILKQMKAHLEVD